MTPAGIVPGTAAKVGPVDPEVIGGAVVGHRQQQRSGRVIDRQVDPAVLAGGHQLGQALGLERVTERDLDLGGGLLGANQGGQPLAADQVDDRERTRGGPAAAEVGHVPAPHLVVPVLQPVRPGVLWTGAGPAARAAPSRGRPAPQRRWPARPTPGPAGSRSERARQTSTSPPLGSVGVERMRRPTSSGSGPARPARPWDPDGVQQRPQLGALVALASGDQHPQWPPAAVAGKVELGGQPTAAAAQGLVAVGIGA